MKLNSFSLVLVLVQLVRVLLLPLVLLLYPLLAWPRERILFELTNSGGEADSFNKANLVASVAFEVSSEGELEQIRPILESFLTKGKRVELVFSSPSVEKKCLEIYNSYKDIVRVKRLPILLYNPVKEISKWMTAGTIIFCRYDFYPELIFYARKKRAIVLSATLKSRWDSIKASKIKRWYYYNLYKTFDFVVAASKQDVERFINLGISKEKLDSYDFRIDRIKERIDFAEQAIEKFPFWNIFHDLIKRLPIEKRVIIGNAWPIEISAINEQMLEEIRNGELLLFVAPHKLGDSFVSEIKNLIEKKIGNIQLITINKNGVLDRSPDQERAQVYLILTPGILCEMYSFFGHSLIGGGFGRSIHSVFEPFFAGSYCYMGPKIFRSTEYDFSFKYDKERVNLLKRPEDFYSNIVASYRIAHFDWDSIRESKTRVEGRILEGEL